MNLSLSHTHTRQTHLAIPSSRPGELPALVAHCWAAQLRPAALFQCQPLLSPACAVLTPAMSSRLSLSLLQDGQPSSSFPTGFLAFLSLCLRSSLSLLLSYRPPFTVQGDGVK